MRATWMAAVLVLGVAVAALADSHVRIVRISFIEHGVEVRHPAVQRWGPALLNSPVIEAEAIRTNANAAVEVQLECGSALRLAPNSEFDFTKLRLRSDGIHTTRVDLLRGTAFFTIRRADSPDFHVALPDGEVETQNGAASFRVQVLADASPSVEILDGSATVRAGKRKYDLKKSVKLTWPTPAAPHAEAVEAALDAPDHWSQWSHDRDQLFLRQMLASRPAPLMDAASSLPPSNLPPPDPTPAAILADPIGAFAGLDAASGIPPNGPLPTSGAGAPKVPYCANN